MGEEKPKKRYLLIKICAIFAGMGFITVMLLVGGLYLYITPNLPDPYLLDDVELQEPLRIYSADNKLIAEYGDKRRIPTVINDIPEILQQAFISAEDDRFYEHPGVDYQGLLRAAFQLALTGKKKQGGSTITMQVARNFFLSKKKTFKRKFEEIFLSLKMEQVLSKDKILELYMNKIFLGKRAYGVASAAKVYYGKTLDDLNLAQMAMIAGLPKAPSTYNPVNNPDRALTRRNYVLGRMLKLNFISQGEYEIAVNADLTAQEYQVANELKAPYIGEMARAFVQTHYNDEDIYNNGIKVYTSVVSNYQQAANKAVYKGLLDYEHRRGYIGRQGQIENIAAVIEAVNKWQQTVKAVENDDVVEVTDEVLLQLYEELAQYPVYGPLEPAVVLKIEEQSAIIYNEERALAVIPWQGLEWAKKRIDIETVGRAPEKAEEVLAVGDLIYIRNDMVDEEGKSYLSLSQVPKVEGALVSLDPQNGALLAMVGGFDYFKNKFNRAMQAERQPGSSFKPFIYTAGLDNGFTTASMINDAPVVFDYPELEGRWKPENYSGKFYGPTRLREGLVKSRNLISIRLLIALGIKEARLYARRFGFTDNTLPYDLSLALGSGTVKPIELAKAYAVFANGGYQVEPFFIDRIEDRDGKVIYYTDHSYVCEECLDENGDVVVDSQQQKDLLQEVNQELQSIKTSNALIDQVNDEEVLLRVNFPATRIIPKDTHFLIHSLLNEVTIRGTGARATRELGRRDLAGKTGTTNDQNDAWFSGYHQKAVGVVWVGYDNHNPLGAGETGTRAALPVWVDYMRDVLKGEPEYTFEQPENVITIRIDKDTGKLANDLTRDAAFEFFREGDEPTEESSVEDYAGLSSSEEQIIKDEIF